MKIAINVLPAKFAGGRDYAEMVIKTLSKIDKENQYFIFLSPDQKSNFMIKDKNFNFIVCSLPVKNKIIRMVWEQIILPFLLIKNRVDLLYTLSAIDVFLSPIPVVIKIGNMAPYSKEAVACEKGILKKMRLFFLRFLSKISSRTSDGIITMSKTAEKELVQKQGFPKNKTKGIVHSADISNLKSDGKNRKIKAKKGFILCVSHLYRYKKIKELIKGYDKARKELSSIPQLLLVGSPQDREYLLEIKRTINKNNLNKKVKIIGEVSRNSLYNLYTSCKFFVFPSIVETCPRTLIEAMKCGAPILCSNASVMPEICQEAAIYFNPNNTKEISEKIKKLSSNKKLLESMKEKSLKRGRDFSWKKATKRTLTALNYFYKNKKL